MTDRFSICLPFTLAQECPHPETWSDPRNFSDDAHDPGGKTMCGITQREYDLFRNFDGEACRDVRECTEDEGVAIYRMIYWEPYCKELPRGLDLQFFDASVNEGCLEAVKILQNILLLETDGFWGPNTKARISPLMKMDGPRLMDYIVAFTNRRKEVYRESKGFPYFGKDWLRRAQEIGYDALKMVTT